MQKLDKKARLPVSALLWQQGCNKKTIADHLNVDPSTISRDLDEAREEGAIREERHFYPQRLKVSDAAELEEAAYGVAIKRPLLRWAKRNTLPLDDVHVLYSGPYEGGMGTWDARLGAFSRAAAPVVLKLLKDSHRCGLTWGATLGSVVGEVAKLEVEPGSSRPERVFPTAGEPLWSSEQHLSSSRIAHQLADFLRPSSSSEFPSLTGIPAVIPRRFRGKQLRAIRSLFQEARPYRMIFGPTKGGAEPLIEEMDCLLTSLGRPQHFVTMLDPDGSRPDDSYRRELIEFAGLPHSTFERLVHTDLGGVLVLRKDTKTEDPKDREILEDFAKLWTGVTEDHLARCTNEAGKAPGVVLLALSAAKADAVIRCIKNKWIRTLIVDHHLGAAIYRGLEARGEVKAISVMKGRPRS